MAKRNSQLVQLRTCAWAYRESYVRCEEGGYSPSLHAGSNVHSAIAATVRAILANDPLDVHGLAYKTVTGGEAEYNDAVEVLTTFVESLGEDFTIDPKAVFLVEERLEMPVRLWDGSVETFFGTVDLAERVSRKRVRITDWKTHWHPETEAEFKADQQIKRYALLVHHHFPGFTEFELVKRFVRYRGNFHVEVLTADDLRQVEQVLASEMTAAKEIEAAGVFTATGGDWCGLCRHQHTCPLIAKWREEGLDIAIPDDQRASEMAGAVIALSAAADRLKEQLKRYLGTEHQTGRLTVPVGGGEYGYGPSTERQVDLKDLREAFAAAGAELPEDVLRVDLAELDRLKKRIPNSLVAAIDAVTHTKQGAQCRFRKTVRKPLKPRAAAPVSGAAPALAAASSQLGEGDLL